MEDLKNPITFQCVSCNTILTDSFFLLERIEDSLLFTDAPNAVVGSEVTSVSEADKSAVPTVCSYSVVKCVCDKEIGRKYLTVNSTLTNCLNNFLIEIQAIRGYQLGIKTAQTDHTVMTNSEINTEITKLQRFCTFLYSKIKEIK
ncbi:uncharacterized protein NEMAJ01_1571 [Nematocida major]|uniref:uncharacterized protein n=1 Tax=Nematocida major TaxID=1912982 RepID=UPI002007A496|nr:uncharacterized protein NEMAJ01_1571 [Nematocida major]KAH9386675.1 hypothetical protein NEMAJ01_1571 [Nematocida major]